jgi:hypothetical protein
MVKQDMQYGSARHVCDIKNYILRAWVLQRNKVDQTSDFHRNDDIPGTIFLE